LTRSRRTLLLYHTTRSPSARVGQARSAEIGALKSGNNFAGASMHRNTMTVDMPWFRSSAVPISERRACPTQARPNMTT